MIVEHQGQPHPQHAVTYFVNGEREESPTRELSVRSILETAGFTPASDFKLKSENPPEDFGDHYDRVVTIHPNQRFQALHKGPTPTS